jgi:predicted S18 family serine protease
MRLSFLLLFLLLPALSASINVPAVSASGSGILAVLNCEVMDGSGRILVSTEPLIGIDTQQSEKTAVQAVSEILGTDFSSKDVVFTFESNGTGSVDGESAGAAMALCLISEISGRKTNPGVSITGTINLDGTIGEIGGIIPKVTAASVVSSVVLVPAGQATINTYIREYYSPKQGIYVEEMKPVKINVSRFALENLGVNVIEVGSISEAEQWIFSGAQLAREAPSFTLPEFPQELPRMKEIAEYEVGRAEDAVEDSNSTEGRSLLERTLSIPETYYYSRSNYAFLAYLASNPGYEDVYATALEMKKQIVSMETGDPHWRAESELRLSWALLSEDLSPATKEWLTLSARMLSLENFSSTAIDLEWVKDKADKMIITAKSEIGTLEESSDAEKSLVFAIRSFNEGMYLASIYNSLDAIAWARASAVSPHRLSELLRNSTEMADEFSEAYRRHAFYLAGEGEYVASAYSLFRAELRQDAFTESPSIIPKFRFPSVDWKMGLIFVLLYFVLRNRKTRKQTELGDNETMLLSESKAEAVRFLQEKLKKGEISDKTYYRLLRELGG